MYCFRVKGMINKCPLFCLCDQFFWRKYIAKNVSLDVLFLKNDAPSRAVPTLLLGLYGKDLLGI